MDSDLLVQSAKNLLLSVTFFTYVRGIAFFPSDYTSQKRRIKPIKKEIAYGGHSLSTILRTQPEMIKHNFINSFKNAI
jgi:hypothetical protein